MINSTAPSSTRPTAYRAAGFWNMMAARYSRAPIADEAVYQEKLRRTQALFTPDARVLEFGCGTGSTALIHAPHVREVIATDISEQMIGIAKAKAAAAGTDNVRFVCSSLADIARTERDVDVVLALNVLHLIAEWRHEIGRVHALLRPGGHFVTSTACLGDNARWARFIAPVTRLSGRLPQVTVLSTTDLLAAMSLAGFEIVDHWQPGKWKATFVIARKPA